MTTETAAFAYARRADEYTRLLGTMDATAAVDRARVCAWAAELDGVVLDVGCGPGHWTGWLDGLRDAGRLPRVTSAAGVDPAVPFVAHAERQHPHLGFHHAVAEQLPFADGTIGGILAWYSLIHTAPERLDDALAEFARVLTSDGGLCIGFFTGPQIARFDHAVTPAFTWPVDALADRVERAGFAVLSTRTRHDPGARPHGDLVARLR